MAKLSNIAIAAALALAGAAPVFAQSPEIVSAVANPARSADNVKLDDSRKPAQVLDFLGLKPGMQVLDLFGANSYWAELMAPVIGPSATDIVWEPKQFLSDKAKSDFAAFQARQPNVVLITTPFEAPRFGTSRYDMAMLNLNYHDTYWESAKYGIPHMDPAAFLAALYAAMKPGGVVGVIDHVANPNDDTRATVEKYHRIDPAVVKADFERAGFVLDGTSDILRNPADDHSLLVFDPAIRGKTDRAMFRFRKPA